MGGCVSSQRDINDTHPNIFTVSNIDDDGNRLSEGHLEVRRDVAVAVTVSVTGELLTLTQ